MLTSKAMIGPTARGLRVDCGDASNVARAIRAMHRVLVEIGWAERTDETAPRVHVDFGSPHTPVSKVIVAIDSKSACLIVCFDLGPPVAADRLEQAISFVTRANPGLLNGNLEIDVQTRTVHFRTGVAFGAGELSEAVIRGTIGAAMCIVEAHAGALLQVTSGRAEADDAIAAVWRLHDETGGSDARPAQP